MTIEEVMNNIEQYSPIQQEAINLAVATQEGEVLEAMVRAIVGE